MFNYDPFFIPTTMTGSYYDTLLKMCLTHGGAGKADRWSAFDQNDQSPLQWRAVAPSPPSDPLRPEDMIYRTQATRFSFPRRGA